MELPEFSLIHGGRHHRGRRGSPRHPGIDEDGDTFESPLAGTVREVRVREGDMSRKATWSLWWS